MGVIARHVMVSEQRRLRYRRSQGTGIDNFAVAVRVSHDGANASYLLRFGQRQTKNRASVWTSVAVPESVV